MPSPGEKKDFETPVRGSEAVRIRLLGGFYVSVGSRVIGAGEWRLKKVRSLIKLLALAENHRLHREQIMNLLWPDLDTKPATNNLHRALHFARTALELGAANASSRCLPLAGDMLKLCPDGPLWVDVESFESAAVTARRGQEPAAYRAAMELYAGELLPEDRYEAWAEERREALRETYLALLAGLAELYEQRAEYEPSIEALRRALNIETAHEEAHRGLMRLYAASGEHERAIAQYEQLAKTLSELGAEPAAASRLLHEEILAGRFPKASSRSGSSPSEEPARPGHNLPNPPSSFVGREREMVGVKRSLAMTGVLTLTGTGGSGKTRLALEVARDLVGTYPDGVWLVELAALSDPALVPQSVAAALSVREQPGQPLTETLSNHLGSKQMLLVLDNCEHLIEACARLVDALLNSCSGLRILATSREALGVAGETNWPLSPLSLPLAGTSDTEQRLPPVEELARYEAIRLFVDRARSRLPDFELKSENARGVVEVCRKLDGIPLAIELATARLGALAVEQVAMRLNDSLRLLTTGARTADPRHRTLRATLKWSHELLDEPEREMFARLSDFAGGWTLEAAEAVGARHEDVLDVLGRLVDKSLVMSEASPGAGGVPRYRMLEPVRQYGREKLEESGEIEQVRERHARHYLSLAEVAEPELIGAGQVAWLEQLETEYGNLRTALSWCLDEEGANPEERAQLGLRLAAALGRFWGAHSPREGLRWLEKGLAKGRAFPPSLRAKALNEAGFVAVYLGDPRSVALLEESLALYRELGYRSGAAMAISHLGHTAAHADDRVRLTALRVEAEALLREPLDQRTSGHLLLFLGIAAQGDRDHEQVAIRIEESLALLKEAGDLRGVAMGLTTLARLWPFEQ